jgi:hypothetical protein
MLAVALLVAANLVLPAAPAAAQGQPQPAGIADTTTIPAHQRPAGQAAAEGARAAEVRAAAA